MESDRWQQIERICHEALERAESERAAFLGEACAGDETLRREVEDLLAQETKAADFLEAPALEVEAQAMARDQTGPRLGQQVGSYEIVSLLGAGGMGEVYLARDATLGRKVALKFLPDFLQGDETARRRFLQEAKLAAALDHPFICKVYGIGDEEERAFISLEYVRGQTLREKLAEGPLALREAWQIASEIAGALAEAHSRGIVHRDLKPTNIMFTPDGHVKVMDFGLAKQLIHADGQEQSLTGMTKTGTTVGTLPYMSPEQVRGQKVDARSDLFSFGVMLYEMLTGEHPFRRSIAADTAVAILGNQPQSLSKLRPEVGQDLEAVVMKLLVKEREHRWQSIEEVRSSLAQLVSDPSSSSMVLAVGKRTALSRAALIAVALMGAVAVVAVTWLWLSRPQPDPLLTAVPLTTHRGIETHPSFSPEGNDVAFAWNGEKRDNWDIYVRQIGTGARLHRLTDDPAVDTAPAWSPDELHIAFVRDLGGGQAEIRLIPSRASVGMDRLVTEILLVFHRGTPWGDYRLAWSADGQWLAVAATENRGEPTAIVLVSVETGDTRRLTLPDPIAGDDAYPAFSPNNRTLAFVRGRSANSQIYLLDLSKDYQPVGEPQQLTSDSGFYGHPVWTLDGREIVFAFGVIVRQRLYRIPVTGPEPMRPLNLGHEAGYNPALSQERARLAFADFRVFGRILQVELPDPGASRDATEWKPVEFLPSTRTQNRASYSHDGKRIAFTSLQSVSHEIHVCDSDGTNEQRLTSFNDPAGTVNTPRWAPDGDEIAFSCALEGNSDICVIGSGGGSSPNLTKHPASDGNPSWSRDGEWIYFSSDRSGDQQIWKMPAAGGKPEQVTENGGNFALESPDGQTLYFSRDADLQRSLWKMPVRGGDESRVSVLARGNGRFSVADRGLYFFSDLSTLKFLSFESGQAIPLVTGLRRDQGGSGMMSVSPDGRWALLNQSEAKSDLMLVENFR